MIYLTNSQMRAADRYTIEVLGVPSIELMERAGTALYQAAKPMAKGGVLIVCGAGNNGGDGFVCARKFKEAGYPVTVVLLGKKQTQDCCINQERYEAIGGVVWGELPDGEYSLVVDCVFGTGFSPRGGEEEIFQKINAYKKGGAKILSADIPSGVGDDGRVLCGGVEADETLSFGFSKLCLALEDGLDYSGKVSVVDIGIRLPDEEENYVQAADDRLVQKSLPQRKRNTHKGSYGRAAIVGGSKQYSGAAYLALSACVRGGAGYSSLYLPKDLVEAFYVRVPEALLVPCGEVFQEEDYLPLLKEQAVGFGIGATAGEKTTAILRFLLRNYTGKLVIDADGLNALAALSKEEQTVLFAAKKCEVVLTPHKKEFARMTGLSVEEIKKNALDISKAYAKKNGVVLLLKGASTIVTDGDKVCLSTAGTAGQAKGGSGDVLTGLLTSILATGVGPYDGAIAAAYLAGKAAEMATLSVGETSLTATDTIHALGKAFWAIQR